METYLNYPTLTKKEFIETMTAKSNYLLEAAYVEPEQLQRVDTNILNSIFKSNLSHKQATEQPRKVIKHTTNKILFSNHSCLEFSGNRNIIYKMTNNIFCVLSVFSDYSKVNVCFYGLI